MKRRIGIINIPLDIIESEPELMHQLFSLVVPVRAETHWHSNSIEYIVKGDCLDEVPASKRPPTYDVIVTKGEDQEPVITFKRESYTFINTRIEGIKE